MAHIKENPIKLIEAWDVFFERVKPLLENSYAIIGIEHIMAVPFDNSVMIPGNIFITQYGQITHSNFTINDAIKILAESM